MKYAIIGCGAISKNHIAGAMNTGLEICALCDIVDTGIPALMEMIPAEQQAGVKYYPDYKDMLTEVKPDLVAIATGSGVKTRIALDCIRAGAITCPTVPPEMTIECARVYDLLLGTEE